MVFSSTEFLLFFLPVVLTLYYVLYIPAALGFCVSLCRRACNLLLLLASLLFYFVGEQWLVWIVIVSTLIDYFSALIIAQGYRPGEISLLPKDGARSRGQRIALGLSILSNMTFLAVFKYFNFGIDSYNTLLSWVGIQRYALRDVMEIALPLGISFYTFQSMSYTIDVYRGKVRATRHFIDFACYVTMFPQLVAGPIVRYSDVAKQLAQRVLTLPMFVSGISRFIIGLSKKVMIANTVAVPVDRIFALPLEEITFPLAWIGAIGYALQIYFDFSGYSDMAIGLGRMLGFDYRENFNYPYSARSMRDFWRRWHISLSTWFRDYLYVPLGGSRSSPGRTYINLVIVFFLCGMWHGAEWTFVAWGLYHGLFLVVERLRPVGRLMDRHQILGRVYTILAILAGWVLFRSDTFWQAYVFLRSMVGLSASTHVSYTFAPFLTRDVCAAMALGSLFATPVWPYVLAMWAKFSKFETLRSKIALRTGHFLAVATLTGLLLLNAMALAGDTYNPFIYFRF
jgi:alginate O-acetyltransferase complex protein AlgI